MQWAFALGAPRILGCRWALIIGAGLWVVNHLLVLWHDRVLSSGVCGGLRLSLGILLIGRGFLSGFRGSELLSLMALGYCSMLVWAALVSRAAWACLGGHSSPQHPGMNLLFCCSGISVASAPRLPAQRGGFAWASRDWGVIGWCCTR